MFKMLDKLRKYDELLKNYNELNEDYHNLKVSNDEVLVHNQSYSITLKETQKELDEKKRVISILKEKHSAKTHFIESPQKNIKQLASVLKLGDKFTINNIIDYLKLDSFEFVKNIA
jgi:predicted nuclease with TOPRIM domain